MKSSICLFEDVHYTRLLPLVYFRPVYNLQCGVLTLRQKLEYLLKGQKIQLHARNLLTEYLRELHPNLNINAFPAVDTWFINGRVVADEAFVKFLSSQDLNEKVFVNGSEVVAAFIKAKNIKMVTQNWFNEPVTVEHFSSLPTSELQCRTIQFPWDLINYNADEIEKDYERLAKTARRTKSSAKVYKGVILLNRKRILLGQKSVIKPGAVLDAEKGPIIIGKNVTIMPNAFIEGPAYIGDHSIIKVGAKIYHGTSIGEWCKVGGEVEASIIHSYSNKQHDGFLGHSYLGSWINIGADTNNSDLKNTYGTIKVQLNGKEIDTGLQFVGLIMGDHSKTGINVMFDTGTIVGVSCNIYGAGLPPKYLPSFLWGEGKSFSEYRLDQSVETARRMMARRNMQVSAEYEKLYRSIFAATEKERQDAGIQ